MGMKNNLIMVWICIFLMANCGEHQQAGGRAEGERESWSRLLIKCGTPCRALFQDSEIMTWAETKNWWRNHPRCPCLVNFF